MLDRRLLTRVNDTGSFAEQLVAAAGIGDADVAAGGAVALRKPTGSLSAVDLGLDPIIIQLLGGIDPDKLVTHWGRDPLWGSANPAAGPYIHQFPLRTAVQTDLSLAETTKAKVAVVGHTPRFDAARGLWYCDIELEAGSSYTPFVRLALARYQPHSIDNAHLSKVVRTDFMQLLPERATSFTPRVSTVGVTVRGPAGYTELAQRITGQPTSATGINASRRLSAQIQRLPVGAEPELGWADVGDEIGLAVALSEAGLGSVSWSGSVPVPTAPAGTQQRVLVREWELLQTDHDPDDPFDATREVVFGPIEFRTVARVRERLVYADTFSLWVWPAAVLRRRKALVGGGGGAGPQEAVDVVQNASSLRLRGRNSGSVGAERQRLRGVGNAGPPLCMAEPNASTSAQRGRNAGSVGAKRRLSGDSVGIPSPVTHAAKRPAAANASSMRRARAAGSARSAHVHRTTIQPRARTISSRRFSRQTASAGASPGRSKRPS